MNKTIFEKIIDKELPANIIFEDDQCIVIEDISPKAPIHLLVIPKKPIKMLSASSEKDQALLGHLMLTVKKVSEQLNIKDNFNVVINNGEKAGQTVFHAHIHIIPRYKGDVKNPRGGVRNIIPNKTNY